MGRRPLLVMVLGWSALVLAVGAITFVVVGNAGRGVGRASAAEWVVSTTSPNSTSLTPSSTLTPTQSSSTSAAATPSASAPESTKSTTEGWSSTPATPGTRPPSSDPAATPDSPAGDWRPAPTRPADDHGTASFSSEGGIVVASCARTKLSLDSIRPRDGWRFSKEVERTGIEVVFKAAGREVEMMLSCVAGVPTRTNS